MEVVAIPEPESFRRGAEVVLVELVVGVVVGAVVGPVLERVPGLRTFHRTLHLAELTLRSADI